MIGFVVNPVSGNGRGLRVWHRVERILQERNVEYIAGRSTCPGDTLRIVIDILHNANLSAIVAIGGDGTVNEAVNGMWLHCPGGKTAPIIFGYIPAGSGNDFARGHNLPTDPEAALDYILTSVRTGKEKNVDVLRFGDRLAVSSIGCGLDGTVADTTNKAGYKKWLNRLRLGKLAYVISLFRVLFSFRKFTATLRIDERNLQLADIWLIAIANIPYYGGGMMIAPDATAGDGKANIIVVGRLGRLELLRFFPLIYKGTHLRHPAVSAYAGASIEIIPESPQVVHADGEIVPSAAKSDIVVLPGWLRIPDSSTGFTE